MGKRVDSRAARVRRHMRVRNKVKGSADRPRLDVFRSANHVYAQIIDDSQGITMVASSTLDLEIRDEVEGKTKVACAQMVGASIAKRATEKGISQVAFDRGGYKYHGRVKALAEAAREGGLVF
ncbi:MAG: 50S ribosomal protein L18 [Chloroflexota bacterium]|nr:50S ribosomal protein L18 [Chloroflexota bacterium]